MYPTELDPDNPDRGGRGTGVRFYLPLFSRNVITMSAVALSVGVSQLAAVAA